MDTISELIVDAYGCEADLSDAKGIEAAARDAVEKVGATVATSICYPFQPHGLTLCLILMESHFVISTWPEHKLAIVNIFLCNGSMNARDTWDAMAMFLKPTRTVFHEVPHRVAAAPAKRKAA